MPIKFAPSVLKVERATGKKWYEHSYMKAQSAATLRAEMEKATPKRRQKIANELARREKLAKSSSKKQ
ncbi:MAG: hypothetical protein VW518_00385 [Burkholderiaceae bacterium]